MITVLCVRFGTQYGREYVERLRNMVSRHLTVPYEFVCLTNDPTPIEGVRNIVIPEQKYAKLWWHKVHMFDPSLGITNRILYFDLDVVIHASINKLVETANNDFYGIKDFNRSFHNNWNYLNSSAMTWIGGSSVDVWDQFKTDPEQVMKRFVGDQDWIWNVAKDRIKFWPNDWLMSYKWEIRNKHELAIVNGRRNFIEVKNPDVPAECCVTVFHGDPKPQDVKDPFVVDNWR